METRSASRSASSKRKGKQTATEAEAEPEVAFGDVIYISLHGASKWWPAQVVDENSVNEDLKPRKRAREVLVRVYGTYDYKYVDPIKCRAEFEKVLKKNDGSVEKILKTSLEKDLPSMKSKPKESSAKNKGSRKRKSAAKDDKPDEAKSQKPNEEDPGTNTPFSKSQELSERRIRVMESLGLIAPPGSPFVRNGHYS